MERRPTSIRKRHLAVSVLALTLIAPGVLGQDPDSITEIRRQAEQGDADAQNNLGVMYTTGKGVTEDAAEAMRWFRLAAEQGHTSAQYNLGIMHRPAPQYGIRQTTQDRHPPQDSGRCLGPPPRRSGPQRPATFNAGSGWLSGGGSGPGTLRPAPSVKQAEDDGGGEQTDQRTRSPAVERRS